jgi:putative ABC transport system permease protein
MTTTRQTPTTTAVQLIGVRKVYGSGDHTVTALNQVSVGFPTGTFTAIMGPSGSGKSTLLQCAAGLDRPTDGQIFVADKDVGAMDEGQRTILRREHIGFVFQAFNLVASLTAAQNVELPLRFAGRSVDRAAVLAALTEVGLGDRSGHRPSELSGGQQQRVALARALITRPDVLFADEPTGALDTTTSREVLTLLRTLVDEKQQTTIMVTHDPVAASYADVVIFLKDGQMADRIAGRPGQPRSDRRANGPAGGVMLALANIRQRWRTFVATFLAVVVGVGLIAVTLVTYDSARPRVQPRLAGAPAMVIPPQAFQVNGSAGDRIPWSEADAAVLTQRLGAVRGVEHVVVDRAFYAQAFIGDRPVADDGALEAGHGWSSASLAPYSLVGGSPPRAANEVVVGEKLGAEPGSRLSVNLSDGRHDFTVSGTVDGWGFFFTDPFAAQRDQGVRAIGLLPAEPGSIDAVVAQARRAAGPGATVVTGDDRGELEPEFIAHKRFLGTQLIAAMALLGLFVTIFVVAATLVLATTQRRREIGLLRTIGAEPRQVRRMILGEAAAIGVAGSVVGCLLGLAAAPLMRTILMRLDVAPPDFSITLSAWPLLTAALVGTGVAVLGAWAASRTAARVAPLEALQDAEVEKTAIGRSRLVAGLVALGAGVVLAVLTGATGSENRINTAMAAAMTFIVAATLLAPLVVGPAVRLLTAPFARRTAGAGPMLVRAEILNATRRAASTAAPIIAAVGFAVLISGMVETMRTAYPAGETKKLAGQVLIDTDGTPGLSDDIVAQNPIGKALMPTRVFVPGQEGKTTVVDALGSRDPRWAPDPKAAVLGVTMAGRLGLTAGQTVPVRFVDGRTEDLRIAQVLPDDPARGDFVVARSTVREHDTSALTDTIFMPAGNAPSRVSPGAALHDAESYALADYNTDARLTNSLAAMLIAVAVGYSGLAVANSMAMSAFGRRTDFTVMMSAGGTRRQLLSFVLAETVLVVVVGVGLGLLVTLPPLAGLASGLAQVTATPVALHLNGAVVLTAVFGSLVMAAAASGIVTWNVIRPRPA